MQFDAALHFMDTINGSLSASCRSDILNQAPDQFIFIKDIYSNYLYANDNYIRLLGLKNLKQLKGLTDSDLYKNKQNLKIYRDLDCFVLEEGKPLGVKETIAPKYNSTIIHALKGKLYPIVAENGRTNHVFGIVAPEFKIFNLTASEFDSLIPKSSYVIKLHFGSVVLSKMDIKILVQLLRGSSADDFAQALQINNTMIASYISSIKNKFGVNNHSELISLVISENILHKIIL